MRTNMNHQNTKQNNLKRNLSLILLVFLIISQSISVSAAVLYVPKDIYKKDTYTIQTAYKKVPKNIRNALKNQNWKIEIANYSLDTEGGPLHKGYIRAGYCDHKNKLIKVLYQCERSITDTSFFLYHEIGHFVNHNTKPMDVIYTKRFKDCYKKEKYKLLCAKRGYEESGIALYINEPSEYFAESFAMYMMHKKALKRYCPRTYKMMQYTVKHYPENYPGVLSE